MRVAGFGMNSRATIASLRAALAAAGPADTLAALPDHAAEVAALARALDLPLITVASVAGIPTLSQSPRSLAAHHTGSVAEAVALAAAGPGARLLAPRAMSPDRCATCAIAQTGTHA
ncbi:cobalamin biosynthesis protein [Paracoccus alkenifer]|nr:cobalamin biosynthesis protein [Paracoccus alkenifer]